MIVARFSVSVQVGQKTIVEKKYAQPVQCSESILVLRKKKRQRNRARCGYLYRGARHITRGHGTLHADKARAIASFITLDSDCIIHYSRQL